VTVVTAAIIQVLVLVLTLAAAGGVVTLPQDRLDAVVLIDSTGRTDAASRHAKRAQSAAPTCVQGNGAGLTAGLVPCWIDQGRGPMPPPVA